MCDGLPVPLFVKGWENIACRGITRSHIIAEKMKREIIRASVLGYCMGVRRAVEIAVKCLETYKGHPVYSFGPLIHNRSALAALEEKGLLLLENVDALAAPALKPDADLSDGAASESAAKAPVVIIRAHGIPPETRRALEKQGCLIQDATCPRVLANQKKAASYAAKGFTVIIAGDKNHGEVTGLAGCVRDAAAAAWTDARETEGERASCLLVDSPSDAASLDVTRCGSDVVLISQTTISPFEYAEIADELKRRIPHLEVLNTVCPATQERQAALDELCCRAEGVLVIGGKNSANTQRLFTSARQKCAHAAHIEKAGDIPAEFFSLNTVGITAGASTPDFVIDAVEARLSSTIAESAYCELPEQ